MYMKDGNKKKKHESKYSYYPRTRSNEPAFKGNNQQANKIPIDN